MSIDLDPYGFKKMAVAMFDLINRELDEVFMALEITREVRRKDAKLVFNQQANSPDNEGNSGYS